MNSVWLKCVVVLLLSSVGPGQHIPDFSAPAAAPDVCSINNTAFGPDERIVYKLYYNWNFVWLSAGEVTFRVHDLPNQYRVTVRGRTYDSYEWFYKVTDNYESYLDKRTLLPQIHIKDIQEGGYSRYDRTTFYQDEHRITSLRGSDRASAELESMAVEACMHDLISIVYYARNLDYHHMKAGDEIPIKVFMDREEHPLKIRYLGPEKDVKIKGSGRYNTLRFSPQLITGELFKEGDEMKIYVSDDDNRIPLMIESPVSVGSVKAILKSYKGLRHPLAAKLD